VAPAADGVLVIAAPRRMARWLAVHPAAALPLALAANRAASSAAQLSATARALVAAADGPVVAWWKGESVGLAATVDPPAAVALERVAALQNLSFGHRDGAVVIAAQPALIDEGATPPPSLPDAAQDLAALVRLGAHWWQVRLGRSWLVARWGEPVEPPPATESSELQTRDLGTFLALAGVPAESVSGPACLAFRGPALWGVRLPGRELPSGLAALVGSSRAPAAAGGCRATLRHGVLGDVWAAERPDLVLASASDVAEALCGLPVGGEEGHVRGPDLVLAGDRVAKLASKLGVGRADARWRQLRPWLLGMRGVRWRLAARGGVIAIEW
jgi:hypothetical protein